MTARFEGRGWAGRDLSPDERAAIKAACRDLDAGYMWIGADSPHGPYYVRVNSPGGNSTVLQGKPRYRSAYEAATAGLELLAEWSAMRAAGAS